MRSLKLQQLVLEAGWQFVRQKGSHRIYKHDTIPGLIVIPFHGSRAIPKGTTHSILKKAGLK